MSGKSCNQRDWDLWASDAKCNICFKYDATIMEIKNVSLGSRLNSAQFGPLCAAFSILTSFDFSLPSGPKGHRWSLTALFGVNWDLTDPPEALKSSQRAVISPTVWQEPPTLRPPSPPWPMKPHSQAVDLSKSSFSRSAVIYCTLVPFYDCTAFDFL